MENNRKADETTVGKEKQLLHGTSDKYGIYQLKDNPELREFHFVGTSELLRRGILSDTFKEINPDNYNLIYLGGLDEVKHETRSQALDELFLKFNLVIPGDFRGHSLSVSDIVVLHEDGQNSVHFVDSFGFTELPEFGRMLEEGRNLEKNSIVADFKAKTKEMFHEIDGLSPEEIEDIVKGYVQEKIDEYGFDTEIVDAAVDGTRCRGLERHGSDLDVVIELSTDEREDVLFDAFHEDGFCIGGVKVDINPITTQRTGTLETYLPQAEDYLDGVREARRKEMENRPSLKEKLEEKKTIAEKRSNQTQSKVIDKGVGKDML